MCGKNGTTISWIATDPGSPPRVREKPRFENIPSLDLGITPACAGKTADKALTEFAGGDHPRVCGKNFRE